MHVLCIDGKDALMRTCYIQQVGNQPREEAQAMVHSTDITEILLSPFPTCPSLQQLDAPFEGSQVVPQVVGHDREQLLRGQTSALLHGLTLRAFDEFSSVDHNTHPASNRFQKVQVLLREELRGTGNREQHS